MGEEQQISRLGELNRIIEFYSERIMELTEKIGEPTLNIKGVVTEKMINIHKSRMRELQRKRDKIEHELINTSQEKVYA